MNIILGRDWGGGVLEGRSWVDALTHTQRIDLSASAVVAGGYSVNLFQSENDAYITVLTRFRFEFSNPLMAQYWKVGPRFEGNNLSDQARDGYFYQGDITDPSQLPINGLIGPDFMKGEWEMPYVLRPGRMIALTFVPMATPHWNAAMNPVGWVYVAGGRLQ